MYKAQGTNLKLIIAFNNENNGTENIVAEKYSRLSSTAKNLT